MKKRKVIVTAAVAATAAAASVMGIYPVYAQTVESTTFTKVATILGVDSEKLIEAFKTARIAIIHDKISKGLIDQVQGKTLIQKIKDSNGFHVLPMNSALRNTMKEERQNEFDQLVTFLNINKSDLKDLLNQGKTLEEIAGSKGISGDQLKVFLTQISIEYINSHVTDTSARAELLNMVSTRVDRMISHVFTEKFSEL